jgi:hypothetical protein
VGGAIAHAHSRNVVHGDINPQNIFITQRGNVRVLDFGASHALTKPGKGGDLFSGSFATPGYVSCQVLEGERPDARDDVFALACVTYLLLSGEHPFKNHTALEARTRNIKARRPAELHGRQWRTLRAGLNWDRERRPADLAAWLQALDLSGAAPRLRPLAELLHNPVAPPRKYGFMVAATAAVVAVIAVGFWFATHYEELSARLAGMVDKSAPIRSIEPVVDPSIDSVTPPPDLSGLTTPARTPPSATIASPPPALTTIKPPIAETAPSVAAARTPLPVASPPTTSTSPAPAPATVAPASTGTPAVAAPPAATRSSVSQIELAADTVDVPINEPSASVLVHRKGNLRNRVGFTWWTESGTAKPGADFAPVAPHVEYFDEGKATVTLSIRLAETVHPQDKSFYVVIDQPEDGAMLGPRALTMITLPGNQSDK